MPTKLKHITTEQWFALGLGYFTFMLPFQIKAIPIIVGICWVGLFWLLSLNFKTKFLALGKNKTALLLFVYYLWVLAGMSYSPNTAGAWKDLLAKIPFLVWPLMLGSVALSKKTLRLVLKVFVLALALSLLLSLILAFARYGNSGLSKEFFFDRFLKWTLISPHYMGMFLNFGFGLLLQSALKRNWVFKPVWFQWILVVFLAAGIFLMAVRIQYLIFLAITIFLLFNAVKRKWSLFMAISVSLALFIISSMLAWTFKPTQRRIVDTYNEVIAYKQMTENYKQTNPRKFLWKSSVEAAQENLLLGTGTAGANDAINQKLKDDKRAIFWDGTQRYHLSKNHHNAHSSYLQHLVSHGLIGLIIYLLIFVLALIKQTKFDFEAKLFLLVSAVSFITESMLERQAGILFFSFFYCLFFVVKWLPDENLETAALETTS